MANTKKTAPVTEEVVKETAEKLEAAAKEVKKTAEKKVAETKKAVEKAVAETKKAAEKTVSETKKAVEKKTAPRKAAAVKENVYVQYQGAEVSTAELVKAAVESFKAENAGEVKSVDLYVKPEERTAYYVINGVAGKVSF